MFFFSRNGEEMPNPSEMTVVEIANMLSEVLENQIDDVIEIKINEKQYKQAIATVEKMVRAQKVVSFNKDSLLSFKTGMLYGLGLGFKITDDARKAGMSKTENYQREKMEGVVKRFAFMFKAIDMGHKNWDEDRWFDELMKNAKVEEPKITKTKKAKK